MPTQQEFDDLSAQLVEANDSLYRSNACSDQWKLTAELAIRDRDEARREVVRMKEAAVCFNCGKPASCVGKYEDATKFSFACNECCGHGCEDGICYKL